MKVELDYRFSIHFDQMIKEHQFTLRITPRMTDFYEIQTFDTNDHLFHTQDGFGNIISFGNIKEPHDHFDIYARAQIDFVDTYRENPDVYHPSLFLFETELTRFSKLFLELIKDLDIAEYTLIEKVDFINTWIFNHFAYEKCVTDVNSSVDVAIEHKKGVCQDFAHLMISMLRYYGIPARYVSGFVSGEGETHAWVEYFDGNYWYGADPTHNILISHEPYVKIAQGRDASDVLVNHGVFLGVSSQYMDIKAIIKVEQ